MRPGTAAALLLTSLALARIPDLRGRFEKHPQTPTKTVAPEITRNQSAPVLDWSGSFSSSMLEHWQAARKLVGLPALTAPKRRTLARYLDEKMYGLEARRHGHPYCRGSLALDPRASIELCYLRVYKSGNDFVCDNMRRNPRLGEILEKQRRPEAMQCPLEPQLAFTFVREPLTHFVSGFSELMFRLAHPEQFVSRVQLAFNGYDAQGVRFHKARLGDAPEAFILDFIDGKFKGGFASAAEVHAWPQVAFLSQHVRAGFSVGMIADLDDSASGWSELGRTLAERGYRGDWPALDPHLGQHTSTDRASNNSMRVRMEELLRQKPAYLEAMCRVMLPDYVCLAYELPSECRAALGDHGVACPYRGLPQRRGKAA